MGTQNRILVVNDTLSTQELFKEILSEFSLTVSDNANDALEAVIKEPYDLYIVTIKSESLDGYDIVEQVKTINGGQPIPVLYLSTNEDDEVKVGIDYCHLDAVSQPYGDKMLVNKIKHTIKNHSKIQQHKNELAEVTDAMLSLQNDNAKLYDICRFLQNSFFCKDIHALCEQLFIVTRAFGISCTVYVHSEKNNFFISDGITHGEQLNQDILKMVVDQGRIFQFGNNRAVFNWECASLLVNKVGSDVDNLAMLMDGFEMGFNAIESVEEFNHTLKKYQKQNYELSIQIARVVDDLSNNISDELNQLGATAMLSVEQEDALVALADNARREVDLLFSEGLKLDEELSDIMTKMRTQKETPAEENDDDGDGIDFF